MARVPVVESPCPVANRPLPSGASDHCAACDRSVHNLDRMNERERRDFMHACGGKVCVAYTMRIPGLRKRGLGVATLAAAAIASLPVAAQDSPVIGMSPVHDANGLRACDDFEEVVVTGGVNKADQAAWADDGKDAPPEIPTIEDDGK